LYFINFGILLGLLYFGGGIILPFIFSIFLFLLLDPLVELGKKWKLPRKATSAILVALSIVFIGAIVFVSYNSLMKIAERLPTYSEKILHTLVFLQGTAFTLHKSTDIILSGPQTPDTPTVQKVEIVEGRAPPLSSFLLYGMNSVLNLAAMLFFIPLISFFMLSERDYLSRRIREIFKEERIFLKSCEEIRAVSRGFFIGNFILATLMTTVFFAVFFYIGLEDRLEFALFAGILNLIPVFGAILGGALPFLQAVLQFDGFGHALVVVLASISIHFVANNLILPKIMGTRVNVNGTAAVIGFLFWGTLWGAMGLFLAIPLMSILRILFLADERFHKYANLIAQHP